MEADVVSHCISTENPGKGVGLEGAFRRVSMAGRSGLQAVSIHSRIRVAHHTVSQDKGSLTLWVLALEDLWCESNQQHIRKHDPMAYSYVILSNHPQIRDWESAAFSLTFCAGWYPQYFVKFGTGRVYPDVHRKRLGYASAGHFSFPKLKWIQLGVCWDLQNNDYRIFANGVKIGCENKFLQHGCGPDLPDDPKNMQTVKEPCGDTLYLGNTAMAFSDLKFYDRALSDREMTQAYHAGVIQPDVELDAELRKVYLGEGFQKDTWVPDAEWELKMDAPLNRPADLELFYVQGNTKSVRMTDEGLEVHTRFEKAQQSLAQPDFQDELFSQTLPGSDPITCGPVFREFAPGEQVPKADPGWARRKPGVEGENQMYLWTRQSFEGDLALEFEFMLKKEFGLGLLCLQATGMQREDFMQDYPLRKSGSMGMVAWENIRNYHWEWFREMGDTYNAVNTHAVCKEPWMKPLAYVCHPVRLSKNEWHTLRFVQEGSHLCGIIDGEVIWEAHDIPNENNGPVYTAGHIALRCMLGTHLVYRNLKVWNKKLPYEAVQWELR
jgi:hypothetical protein